MPNVKFLQEFPLYRAFPVSGFPPIVRKIPRPAINMLCETCKTEQTFRMDAEYRTPTGEDGGDPLWRVLHGEYVCMNCRTGRRDFFFVWEGWKRTDEKTDYLLRKVGQWPAWSIQLEPELARLLGERADTYRNGLVCESQSYGIGAFAYYRRVVELIIDDLVTAIGELARRDQASPELEAQLAKIRASHQADEKIRIAKELLPASLRPEGFNPLSTIHDALSRGLHGLSDEECLQLAVETRAPLEFLIKEVMRSRAEHAAFTHHMRRLVAGRTKKSSPPKALGTGGDAAEGNQE
jgi:hypothetical protein